MKFIPLFLLCISKPPCPSSNDSHPTNPQSFNIKTQTNPCNHAQPSLKQTAVYLRNIPSQMSMQAVKKKMADKGIDLEGCTLGDSTLGVGSRKSIKVTCDSLDRCNLLDRELKSNPDLPWFLSLHPPRRPHRGSQYRNKLNSHSQLNVPPLPSNQQPFLSKCPPPTPLMDILLPPLRNRLGEVHHQHVDGAPRQVA